MKDFVFSTDFGGVCARICFFGAYVEFCYWVTSNNQGLGRHMEAASDIFIGWYIGYFICPSVAAGSTGRHSEFDIAR
jgi:hypothetical protein